MTTDAPTPFLQSGNGIDADHPDIQAYVERIVGQTNDPAEKAVRLFYTVRDDWRYDPYQISFRPEAMRASRILAKDHGHCLDKGILLTGLYRAAGLPARLCLAKVRNHIAAARMIEAFGTDELVPHGYVEVWLNDRWLKVTPAFNRELCDKLGVSPLEFDGTADALFQEFDREGGDFMEYLEEYGYFMDVPLTRIQQLMVEHYPHLFSENADLTRDRLLQLTANRTSQT